MTPALLPATAEGQADQSYAFGFLAVVQDVCVFLRIDSRAAPDHSEAVYVADQKYSIGNLVLEHDDVFFGLNFSADGSANNTSVVVRSNNTVEIHDAPSPKVEEAIRSQDGAQLRNYAPALRTACTSYLKVAKPDI